MQVRVGSKKEGPSSGWHYMCLECAIPIDGTICESAPQWEAEHNP